MNIQDRRRVSSLIEREFHARRNAIKTEFSREEVQAKSAEIAKRSGLDKDIARLAKLRETVAVLEKDMSARAEAIPGAKRSSKYRNGCECITSHVETIEAIATAELQEAENAKARRDALYAEERRLLAMVESASSSLEIKNVLAKAGLLGK